MGNDIFAFTLYTETELEETDAIFDTTGELVGRILRKHNLYNGNHFSYDIESTKEDYENIKSGKIKLYNIINYSIHTCSTWYTRKE